MIPVDLKYSETHEWVKLTGKNTAIIGITGYAVSRLSDLVHIELPKVGDSLVQGASFGEVESVKTVAELISPLSGKVLEMNKEAQEHLDLITEEPYEDGWLIKVKLSDPTELEELMTSKEYGELIKISKEEEEEKKEKGEEEEVDEGFFM